MTASRPRRGPRRRARRAIDADRVAYGAPLIFILVPLLLFLLQSFFSRRGQRRSSASFTLENYVRFFSERRSSANLPLYLPAVARRGAHYRRCSAIRWRCLLASLTGRLKYTLMLLFVVPLLMSYIIKIYAIRSILGGNGFLNRMLIAARHRSTSR